MTRIAFFLLAISLCVAPAAHGDIDPKLTGTQVEHGKPPTTELPEMLTVGLRIDDYKGADFRGGQPVLDAQGPMAANQNGNIVLDVSESLTVPPGERRTNASDKSWNGSAPIRLRFVSDKAARMDLWARMRNEDRTMLEVAIDGFARRPKIDKPEKDPGAWRWVKLWSFRVKKGEGVFEARRRFGRGLEIDGFALTPQNADGPTGPVADLPTERAQSGPVQLTTRATTLPAVKRLVSCRLTGPNAGIEADWSVSTDGGKTWREAPGGRMATMDVPRGPITVAVRAELDVPDKKNAPLPTGIELVVQPDPEAWLSIRNDFLQVLFDRTTGRLVRLRDIERDRDIVWPDQPASLFSIDLKRKGEAQWLRYTDDKTMLVKLVEGRLGRDQERAEGLGPGEADRVAGADAEPARLVGVGSGKGPGYRSLALDWLVEKRVKLTLNILLTDSGQSYWVGSIVNEHPELDVIRLEFPRFESVRLGASGYDDIQRRFQTFDQDANRPGINPVHDAIYPGGVAMPWETLHDDRGGFSRASYDHTFANTEFTASTEGRFGDTVTVSTRKLDRVKAGGGVRHWAYGVSVHPGAWHWAADRYRAWALGREKLPLPGLAKAWEDKGYFVRPDYPDWFDTNDGFYFLAQMNLGAPYTDYPKYADEALRMGLNHVQVWGQFTDLRYGCCGPYWQPSPRYGTLEEFTKGIADAREMGVRMGFYFVHDRVDLYHPNGTHIYGFIDKDEYPPGTEFPDHDLWVKLQWVSDPAGKEFAYPLSDAQWDEYHKKIEAHRENPKRNKAPRKWHPVDLTDPDWWEYIRHWGVDKYAGDWGAAGIYNDVLATGSARVSYDPRKGHHGDSMAHGKADIARVMVESARAKGFDDFFHLAEGCADIVHQWCAPANMGIYRFKTEMFRYSWPDAVIFEGTAGQGSRNMRRVRAAAWLNGNRYDMRTCNNESARIIAARAAVRPWIYKARYLDTLGLDSPVESRLHRRLDDDADGAAITFHNTEGNRDIVRVAKRYAGDVRRGVSIDHLGEMTALDLTDLGDTVTFPAPAGTYAVAVLAARADLGSGLIVHPTVERVPTVKAVRVNIGNLTDGAVTGRIVPKGFGAYDTPEPAAFACRAGEVTQVTFDLAGATGAFARPSFDVVANGRVVKTVEVSIFPFFEDPSFEETGNDIEHVAEGERSKRIDPKKGYNAMRPQFYLEPSRRYRIRVAIRRPKEGRGARFVRLVHKIDYNVDIRKIARPKTTGEWETIELTFETAPSFIGTSMYMYNNNSTSPVWYDNVRVEDLGPAKGD